MMNNVKGLNGIGDVYKMYDKGIDYVCNCDTATLHRVFELITGHCLRYRISHREYLIDKVKRHYAMYKIDEYADKRRKGQQIDSIFKISEYR